MLDLAMDLEGDCSTPRPVDEKEEPLEKTNSFDEIQVENNGSCANENWDLGSGEHLNVKTSAEINGKEIGIENLVETSSKVTESPGVSGVTLPTTKGYGLKKWRRIRRDFATDGGSGVDLNRILKRGLGNVAEPVKSRDPFAEIKQKSEDSVASVNSSIKSAGVPSGFSIKGSSSNSRLPVGSAFPFRADSENSEDRSSKSSTAASVPKLRYDVPIVRDKHKAKNVSGRSSGNVVQRAQQGKGRIETSKKHRGERVKIEKENSYSSVESDLRSSNIAFTQMGGFFGTSNGRQSERPSSFDGENGDDAQASEPQSSEEVRTDYCKENGGEVEDVSQDDVAADVSWEVKEEESDNHQPQSDWDPLVKSIISLQAVQEVLEKEIQKFGEIGKEPVSLADDFIQGPSLPKEFVSADPKIHEPDSSGQLSFKKMEQSGVRPLEAELIKLNEKVNLLESKLEEASVMLMAKESRVVELEVILSRSGLQKEESGSTLQYLQENCREMEIKFEGLFKQKIEAEIEYLAMTRTTQKLKVAMEDQLSLFEEQKCLAEEQNLMLHKLKDAESKAVELKRQAEELDASCGELLGTEVVLNMQNRVCKHTLCFFVQLLLLFLAFVLFLLQLLPSSTGVVPT